MRCACVVLAVAGAAHAQSWTWFAEVSDPVIEPGESVTVTIFAAMEYDTPFIALSAFQLDALVLKGAESGTVTAFHDLHDLADHPHTPYTDGDSVFDMGGYQLTVFGPFTSDNPLGVYEFTWFAETPGEVVFTTSNDWAWMWAGDDKESAVSVEAIDVTDTTFGWTVIPAPAGVLAFGLLAAWRRR